MCLIYLDEWSVGEWPAPYVSANWMPRPKPILKAKRTVIQDNYFMKVMPEQHGVAMVTTSHRAFQG